MKKDTQDPIQVKGNNGRKSMDKCAQSLNDMMARVKKEPKLVMLYPGIKEKSVGIIVGPSKSGKTIFCENLGMSIAAGLNEYLGASINIGNRTVLFISFEEHYSNRTDRNSKQADALTTVSGKGWLKNYIVVNEHMPRYIITNEHWNDLRDLINAIKPGIVFLDSLTRMYQGSIEESKVAVELTQKLRSLSEATGTTIVIIHHTHKMYGQPLSIDTVAGSRVIVQEMDFMIGINRTLDGKSYMKDIAFRYAQCDSETVRTFTISENCWINISGHIEEMKLLSSLDGRRDDVNRSRIFELLTEQQASGVPVTTTQVLVKKLVPQIMSRQTLFTNLGTLEKEGKIKKQGKGNYALAA